MRAYNFSPGPSMLPNEVIEEIRDNIFDWQNTKTSILELSHRSKEFIKKLDDIRHKLKLLLNIPNNYQILFSHGGAQGQFSAIPMNLATNTNVANYLVTGVWSEKAVKSANQYTTVNVVNQSILNSVMPQKKWNINYDADYFYYCHNETVNGVILNQILNIPNHIPLVCDVTSSILTQAIEVDKFGLIFASAQKTLGIAGVTLIIIRNDLLERVAIPHTPNILNYKTIYDNNSLVNTMPVFALYVMDLMLEWTIKQGGVKHFEQIHNQQAKILYDFIDKHDFYINNIDKLYRSNINIPFDLRQKTLIPQFLDEATNNNLINLKSHALVGGLRASFYNAMPLDAAYKLVDFCQYFMDKYDR